MGLLDVRHLEAKQNDEPKDTGSQPSQRLPMQWGKNVLHNPTNKHNITRTISAKIGTRYADNSKCAELSSNVE